MVSFVDTSAEKTNEDLLGSIHTISEVPTPDTRRTGASRVATFRSDQIKQELSKIEKKGDQTPP